MVGAALSTLADIAQCVSGDFHTMHLNIRGPDFDRYHKAILKGYYEQAAEDYDTWAEAALMFDDIAEVPNTNGASARISWQAHEGAVDSCIAIAKTNEMLDAYLGAMLSVFSSLNTKTECYRAAGVANTLQTRIEYWGKELAYFNARRA